MLKNVVLWDEVKGWCWNDLLLTEDHIAEEGELSGCALLPGFVDAHVHIALDDGLFLEGAPLGWAKDGVAAVRDCAMLSG